MDKIEEIAGKLSAIESWTLVHGHCGLPRTNDEWSADCICSGRVTVVDSLCRLGLAYRRDHFPNGFVRSEAGLQLKAYLERSGR